MLHQTATLPDGLCDVWPGLLLCQDLTASANIRPVRPVRGPGEEGRLHHNLQGLLRPRHVDGPPSLVVSLQTFNFTFHLQDVCFQSKTGLEYCWCSSKDLCNQSNLLSLRYNFIGPVLLANFLL